MTRTELPDFRSDPFMATAPSIVIPPLLCWRCGADCTATHKTIHDLGRDMHVCAAGCVPTITKETP